MTNNPISGDGYKTVKINMGNLNCIGEPYADGWWSNPVNSMAQWWIFVPIIGTGLIFSILRGCASSDWRPKNY